jgi:hypothetical protein
VVSGGGGWLPPSPILVKCRLWQHLANHLVNQGPYLVNRDPTVRSNYTTLRTRSLLWGVLCRQVWLSPPLGEEVGLVLLPQTLGMARVGEGAGPGGGPGVGVGVSPQPRPRAGSRDRPHPVTVNPLVRARSQICPACNLRLHSVPVPLICQCCRAQYHKQVMCSGLTPGALDVWKRSKHWECISCIDNQARNTVNDPEVNPVCSRGSRGGVRRGLRVLQWNVDGIGTTIADVITLVRKDPGLDVLLLQETKLIPANPTPTLPGYSAIRRDRPPNRGGRGGGLLTYVKADIPFCQIPAYREKEVTDGLEALAVEIQRGARGKFVVTNLYNVALGLMMSLTGANQGEGIYQPI